MTIAISLKVNDGLVLAADSAATVLGLADSSGSHGVLKIYNNANKIFNLYEGLPIGAVTWGMGSIGIASISTIIKDLRQRFMGNDPDWSIERDNYAVSDVAEKVRHFIFHDLYEPTFSNWTQGPKPSLGFIVAGYSIHEGVHEDMAEEYQFTIDAGAVSDLALVRAADQSGVSWNGVIEPIYRLLYGYSPQLPKILQDRLGVPQDQIAPAMEIVQQALFAPLVLPPMPLQDAIDLAEFLVDLTINYSRFVPGAPVVGGPMEVAAISKHEGFKWIRRKYYFSRDLNPEGEKSWTGSPPPASP